MTNEYIKYATSSERLPLDLRTNRSKAIECCSFLRDNKIEIKNKDMLVLASWVGIELCTYNNKEVHSKIKSITRVNDEVVADFTVPTDHSYVANGIVVHNCNLPASATQELVSQVYMRAWEAGCKGFTVYRDGCRTGVLVSEDAAKKLHHNPHERPVDILSVMAPKRPAQLPCEIKKAKINGEAWTIFVGLLNNRPYEIFGGLSKFVDIPNKHKTGFISKNGKNHDGLTTYNLIVGDSPDDQMVIKDIANLFENKTHEAFTRMVSLNLRHGTPIQFVVEQLTKDKYAEMTSFSKVVARVLKSYIKDGSKSASEKKCEACGTEGSLIYQEGCITCTACKTSKCG